MSNEAAVITRGGITQGANTVLRGVITFMVTPLLIFHLGGRHYGFWVMAVAVFGSYELFDFGTSVAVSRFLARAVGRGDAEERGRILSTAFVIFLGMGGAVAAVTLAVVALLPRFVGDPGDASAFRTALLLLGFGLTCAFPLKAFRGLLVAHVRYDLVNVVALVRAILANAAIAGVLIAGRGIVAVAAVTAAAGVCEGLAIAVLARRLLPGERLSAALCRRRLAGEIFRYGGKAFVSQLADKLRFRIDSLIIAGLLRLELVAVYDIGQRLSNYVSQVVESSINVMTPVFSRDDGRHDFEGIKRKYLLLTGAAVTLSVSAGSALLFYGSDFITRWVGAGYHESYVVLAVLSVPMMLELVQSPGIQLLYGVDKHDRYAAINVAEACVNLVLTLLFVRIWGLYGAAWATAVEIVAFKSLLLPVVVCRTAGVPLRDYLRTAGGKLLPTVAVLGVFYAAAHPFLKPDFGRLALIGLTQAILVPPLLYRFALGREERSLVRRVLGGRGG